MSMDVQIRTGYFTTTVFDLQITSQAICFIRHGLKADESFVIDRQELREIIIQKVMRVNTAIDICTAKRTYFGFFPKDDPSLAPVAQSLYQNYGNLIQPPCSSWQELFALLTGGFLPESEEE